MIWYLYLITPMLQAESILLPRSAWATVPLKSTNALCTERYQADLTVSSLYIIDEGLEVEDVMALIKRIENEELDLTRVVVCGIPLR